jgi:AcrR family transcriptional regulator
VVKRRRLNRDRVVAAAVGLADAAGRPEEVTLTRLAAELDVKVPSLYNHVDGLGDLQQAMAVYGGGRLIELLRRASLGRVGREAMLAMAGAYRHFAQEHPGIYPLTIRAPEPDEAPLVELAQELLQMLLLVLASLGLEGEAALHAIRGWRALLHGFVALESAGGFKMGLDRDESFERLIDTYLDGLFLPPQATRPFPR